MPEDCGERNHDWFEDTTVFNRQQPLRRVCKVCHRVEREFIDDFGEKYWLFTGHSYRLEKYPRPSQTAD